MLEPRISKSGTLRWNCVGMQQRTLALGLHEVLHAAGLAEPAQAVRHQVAHVAGGALDDDHALIVRRAAEAPHRACVCAVSGTTDLNRKSGQKGPQERSDDRLPWLAEGKR